MSAGRLVGKSSRFRGERALCEGRCASRFQARSGRRSLSALWLVTWSYGGVSGQRSAWRPGCCDVELRWRFGTALGVALGVFWGRCYGVAPPGLSTAFSQRIVPASNESTRSVKTPPASSCTTISGSPSPFMSSTASGS